MASRIPLVAGNWKMHKTPAEAGTFARNLLEKMTANLNVNVVVCPPFPAIPAVAHQAGGKLDLLGRPEYALGSRRGLYRRGVGADAAGPGLPLRDPGTFGDEEHTLRRRTSRSGRR